jgi:chromosome segregation ATPase
MNGVLYIAEVQKQKGGLLGGGGKTELKLLACQRTDQSWSTVSEEMVASEEANKLNDGALLLVELNPNRQVQRIQEAGRPLINILQNFSRQIEKFKVKEEEIDQWKESLTFQAQELNRREMEMETRLEQLQSMEDEFKHLEEKQQELEASRQEIEQLQAEIQRNREELEGAWEHLRGEQRRLEEYKTEFQQCVGTDEEQSRILCELLDRLATCVAPTETVRENLNNAVELVETQQGVINPHWEQFNQQKTAIEQQQQEVNRLSQMLSEHQNQWQQTQNTLEHQILELKLSTATLTSKQEYAQILNQQLQKHQELYQQIRSLTTSDEIVHSQNVDLEALEKMPLEELQTIVHDLQEKLHIDSSFVNDQEQELKYKQQTIEELENKINSVSELERSNLETDLAEEKDLYRMLNETLVGQRRCLHERQEIFQQHQAILLRRQVNSLGNVSENTTIDLKPILSQIETYRQQHLQQLQHLEREIDHMHISIEQAQSMIEHQTQQQEIKRQEIQTIEENLQHALHIKAELQGRLNLYQEALQPIQDCLDGLRQQLENVNQSLAQVQETGDYQLQAITQMRQTLSQH